MKIAYCDNGLYKRSSTLGVADKKGGVMGKLDELIERKHERLELIDKFVYDRLIKSGKPLENIDDHGFLQKCIVEEGGFKFEEKIEEGPNASGSNTRVYYSGKLVLDFDTYYRETYVSTPRPFIKYSEHSPWEKKLIGLLSKTYPELFDDNTGKTKSFYQAVYEGYIPDGGGWPSAKETATVIFESYSLAEARKKTKKLVASQRFCISVLSKLCGIGYEQKLIRVSELKHTMVYGPFGSKKLRSSLANFYERGDGN